MFVTGKKKVLLYRLIPIPNRTLLTVALKRKDIFMEVLIFWPPECKQKSVEGKNEKAAMRIKKGYQIRNHPEISERTSIDMPKA